MVLVIVDGALGGIHDVLRRVEIGIAPAHRDHVRQLGGHRQHLAAIGFVVRADAPRKGLHQPGLEAAIFIHPPAFEECHLDPRDRVEVGQHVAVDDDHIGQLAGFRVPVTLSSLLSPAATTVALRIAS